MIHPSASRLFTRYGATALAWGLLAVSVGASRPASGETGVYSFLDNQGAVYFSATPSDQRYQPIGQDAKADAAPASSDIVVLGRATGPAHRQKAIRSARAQASLPRHSAGAMALADVPMTKMERRQLAGRTAALPAARIAAIPGRPPRHYTRLIVQAARKQGIDSALVHAVVQVESNFRPTATSPKGAIGLMQLMPGTARQLGVRNPADPVQNLVAGTHYLKQMINQFGGDLKLGLAAYNAGAGNVTRFGRRIPPFRETRQYVSQVLAFYARFQQTARH